MKRHTCDVCDRPLPVNYVPPPCPPTAMQLFCGVVDICPVCRAAESKIDGPQNLLKLWKRKAGVKNRPGPASNIAVPHRHPASNTMVSSEERREKKEIYGELMEYRRLHGIGCYTALAKKAGLKEESVRDIVDAKRVPMTVWEKVGEALKLIANEREMANRAESSIPSQRLADHS